jgi:hypothetical protein
MTRIYVTALLALAALAAPTSTLFAQTTQRQGTVNGGQAETCYARAGGSRMRSNNCEPERERTIRKEAEVTVRVELGGSQRPQCEASALTEYFQQGTLARVTGTVSISACPAGTTGAFTLVARIKDESGELKPLEFKETWQHDEARPLKFGGDYPIGEKVELVSMRVRNLTCTCAETTAPETAAAETAAVETPALEAVPRN